MPSECRNGSSTAPSSANRAEAFSPCVTAARNSSSRVLASFMVMAFLGPVWGLGVPWVGRSAKNASGSEWRRVRKPAWKSGLMRLDKRRALLKGRHALIQHRGVELPIVGHAVKDLQVGGDARGLHARNHCDRVVVQPFPSAHVHKRRRQAAEVRIERGHRGRLAIPVTKVADRKEFQDFIVYNSVICFSLMRGAYPAHIQ